MIFLIWSPKDGLWILEMPKTLSPCSHNSFPIQESYYFRFSESSHRDFSHPMFKKNLKCASKSPSIFKNFLNKLITNHFNTHKITLTWLEYERLTTWHHPVMTSCQLVTQLIQSLRTLKCKYSRNINGILINNVNINFDFYYVGRRRVCFPILWLKGSFISLRRGKLPLDKDYTIKKNVYTNNRP